MPVIKNWSVIRAGVHLWADDGKATFVSVAFSFQSHAPSEHFNNIESASVSGSRHPLPSQLSVFLFHVFPLGSVRSCNPCHMP